MKQFRTYLEGIRIAVRSLRANRLRTLLTMLGVAIGIFAITIIFTLVNSLNYNLNRNLSRLGSSALFVHHFPWTGESFNNWQKFFQRPKVSYNEFQRLQKNLRRVEGVSYEVVLRSTTFKYKSRTVNQIRMRAITIDHIPNHALEIEEGRGFTELEADAGRPVCIIGYNVAQNLFGNLSPIGREVRMQGKRLRVVGVVAKSGTNMFGSSPDDMAYIPYGFAARIYDLKSKARDRNVMVKVRDVKQIDLVEGEIIGIMRSARGLRPRAENNFSINRPEMLMDVFGNVTKYLWWGGLAISVFAVIVAGFGIGNIMFTTVKERTFEIGLQKALGALRGVILFQFLVESVLLCVAGGAIGLLLNFLLSLGLQAAIDSMELDFEIVVSVGSIVFGVILSVVIGLISGVFPSLVASRMDPVEAMRA